MTDQSSFSSDSFPEFVAQNYSYSDSVEYYEGDKEAAAQEVRDDIAKLLSPLRNGFTDEVVLSALKCFVERYPIGQDLDKKLGALGIGMEREINDLLISALASDLGEGLVEVLQNDLNTSEVWSEAGDISRYFVRLFGLVRRVHEELELDPSASLLVAKYLSFNVESGINEFKKLFESNEFKALGISRSDFVRRGLGSGTTPASLLDNILEDEDAEDLDEDLDDDYDDDQCDEEAPESSAAIFSSLEEAKKASDGVVIMEGDWGGQIYLTCPARFINCSEETLVRLLSKIDGQEWGCNESDGAAIFFGSTKPGEGVGGGMGGGKVVRGLWIHPSINPELAALIRRVISGESKLDD